MGREGTRFIKGRASAPFRLLESVNAFALRSSAGAHGHQRLYQRWIALRASAGGLCCSLQSRERDTYTQICLVMALRAVHQQMRLEWSECLFGRRSHCRHCSSMPWAHYTKEHSTIQMCLRLPFILYNPHEGGRSTEDEIAQLRATHAWTEAS